MARKSTSMAHYGVRICRVDRLPNSVNGNPRFDITFETPRDLSWWWTYRTSSDSACVYDVDNLMREKALVKVFLTRADRVCRLVRLGEKT